MLKTFNKSNQHKRPKSKSTKSPARTASNHPKKIATTTTRFPHHAYHSPRMSTTTSASENVGLPPTIPPTKIALSPPAIQRISFFGTSSAVPQPSRANVSSLSIGLSSGAQILVDCGEATQHQLMLSNNLTMGRIEAILITHLHGDHFFGIFGLLASLGTLSRAAPLTVVGPKGLKNAIDSVFNTEFRETTPVPNSNADPSVAQSKSLVDDNDTGYPLKIIEVPTNVPTLLGALDRGADPDHPFTLASDIGVDIMCVPIEHRVPCVGYVIHERAKVGRIDAKKARELGAKPTDMAILKSGTDINLPNGDIIYSKDVCDEPKLGKSIAVVQDTHDPTTWSDYFNNVHTMIHECTFDDELFAKSIDHGHSTPSMAATFAFAKNSKDLFLTHFSSRYVKEYPYMELDGTSVFFNAPRNEYVPRQLLCQLSVDELALLKTNIEASNSALASPMTPSKPTSPASPVPVSAIDENAKRHFANQMNDPTVDEVCCGAGDAHHHDEDKSHKNDKNDQNSQNNPKNHNSTLSAASPSQPSVKKQRLDPQILAYQRDMPFFTQIRTNDFGISSTVGDLCAQAQFCVEQLWVATERDVLASLGGADQDTVAANTMNDEPVKNEEKKKAQDKSDKYLVDLQSTQLAAVQSDLAQLPNPIPSIDSLLSQHSRVSTGENGIAQNKTRVWVGADFRMFDFQAKNDTWAQVITPDIDMAKYSVYRTRKETAMAKPML